MCARMCVCAHECVGISECMCASVVRAYAYVSVCGSEYTCASEYCHGNLVQQKIGPGAKNSRKNGLPRSFSPEKIWSGLGITV